MAVLVMFLSIACCSCGKSSGNDPYSGNKAEVKSVAMLTISGVYDSFPQLSASFDSSDKVSANYTAGFEYQKSVSVKSTSEPFSDGAQIDFGSPIQEEWISVNTTIAKDCTFSVKLNLPSSSSYYVRAWARAGNSGEKVYSDAIAITVG